MRGLILRGAPDKVAEINALYKEKLETKLSQIDHQPTYLKKGIPYGQNVIAVVTHLGAARNNRDKVEKHFGVTQASLEGQKYVNQLQSKEILATAIEDVIGKQDVYYGANIVGDAGDIYYAQKGANETATNDFDFMELGSGSQTPSAAKGDDRSNLLGNIAGSEKNIASGYPQSDDTDTDNTGKAADVTTWLGSYTTGDFNNSDIQGVIITNTGPGSVEPILTRAILSTFTKTATDTLKLFVNHTANGV